MEAGDKNNLNQDIEKFREEFVALFKNSDPIASLSEFLNSMPSAAAILTPERKIIFANSNLLNSLGFKSLESVLGSRPGEALKCLHALENENECGISESCKVCGALKAMKNTQSTKAVSVSEMRLQAIQEGFIVNRDFRITVTPIQMNKMTYMILYINDISHEKRRLILEKIFFHDVLNKVSSLYGLSEILRKETNSDKITELLTTVDYIVSDLTGEILEQRDIIAAEKGDLSIRKEPISLNKLLNRVASQVHLLNNPNRAKIRVDIKSDNLTLYSDPILLNRVVTNMAKNALEASFENETVVLKAVNFAKKVIISVQNKAVMDDVVKLQVFHRSFSTKGDGRGLGTYSIKLLSERYLGGTVSFQTSEEEGTIFYLELPI
jgi:signal transduction histidine kinase